jgi:DNA repair exonuclease SbcCD ATPase subunit
MNDVESMSISEPNAFEDQETSKNVPPLHNEDESSQNEEENPQPAFEEVGEEESAEEAVSVHERHADSPRDKGQKQHYALFLEAFERQSDADSKLQMTIAFMVASLAQHGSPFFKSFWDARTLALQLFKENINPNTRSDLWAKYSELSKEARRLKEILDEQSAFAAEQIEMAIKALEDDLQNTDEQLEKMESQLHLPPSAVLKKSLSVYERLQNALNLLNTQASRINAMRKELIRTEMRVRQKNKFFQRLSTAGDKVFPRRKELIKEVSQLFIRDVDAFIEEHFGKGNIADSLFFLREEIKSLQGIAKLLTLNTQSFTHTRMRLSECWDKIKHEEKERKKERSQQREVYKHNAQQVQEKIEAFSAALVEGTLSVPEASQHVDDINAFMRSMELGRDEVKQLKDELNSARKPLLDKIREEEEARQAIEEEKNRLRKQRIIDLHDEVTSFMQSVEEFEVEAIILKRDELLEKIASSPINKMEKQELEKTFKPLKDIITDKKEKALMSLSDDDRQAFLQLKEVLKQRKERRQEVKGQIDQLRKASGSSGMDFEKAMAFNEQMALEKERLEKLVAGIREIEEKLSELEKKL